MINIREFFNKKILFANSIFWIIIEVHILKTIKISRPQLIHSDEFMLESQLADQDL